MTFLDQEVKEQVSQALKPVTNPVELVVYTASKLVLPGQEPAGLQEETLALLKEVAELSPHLSVAEKPIASDPEAALLGITRAPTILLREAGSTRTNIRFLGLPSGYEFSTLIETVVMLGSGQSGLGERSRVELGKLDSPVRMQVFVTPTCPYCPKAVLTAFNFAFLNPHVVAEGVEANEFPVLSDQYQISGVPDTVISGKTVERVLGGQPDRVFVEATLKAAGVAA